MRTRIALFYAKQKVLLREVDLKNKPNELLMASSKGTVPVLVICDDVTQKNYKIIDQSLAIMLWALKLNDPKDLLFNNEASELMTMLNIINKYDSEFKPALEKYKCAKRYHENTIVECREACEVFIKNIEQRLSSQSFIMSTEESLVDIALLPYIRQFARVERQWYLQSRYPKTRMWLNNYLQSPMFTKIMAKHPIWLNNTVDIAFNG